MRMNEELVMKTLKDKIRYVDFVHLVAELPIYKDFNFNKEEFYCKDDLSFKVIHNGKLISVSKLIYGVEYTEALGLKNSNFFILSLDDNNLDDQSQNLVFIDTERHFLCELSLDGDNNVTHFNERGMRFIK